MKSVKRMLAGIFPPGRANAPAGYALPGTFYVRQCGWLALTAVFLLWMSRDGRLDAWFTAPWFDSAAGYFPLQNHRWLELINHRFGKAMIIALGVCTLLYGLYTRNRRLLVIVLMMVGGALAISMLKAYSAHSCPWDLVQYGGRAEWYPLLSSPSVDPGPGRCFPGGHASTGFVLMAWFFWFFPERPRLALCCWWLAAAFGLFIGYGQLIRGAHFMSHNLWTGWWVWVVQLLIFKWASRRNPPFMNESPTPT